MGNRRWLLVGTNYFTKWVEIEPLSNIRDVDAKKFVWKNILLLDLGFSILLSRIMGFSLIAKFSESIVVSLALGIGIQPWPFRRGMGKLK